MPRKKELKSEDFECAFPTRLREIMGTQGKTQQDVADAVGKTRQAIGYYADGSSSPDWKTIVKLAQFFSVSTDWLLGLTDVQSSDTDMKQVCDYTGLSEKAVEQIVEWKYAPINFLSLLNQVLMSGSFHMMMYHAHDFRDCVIAEQTYWKLWGKYFPEQSIELQKAEGEQRKEAFCVALKKMIEETSFPCSIKNKIWAEHQIWNGNESYEYLRDSLIDVGGFALSDIYEYRTSKDLSDLLHEIRNGIVASVDDC